MQSESDVIKQYKRRIENIYKSTNPAKIQKIDKWLKKYKDNPHDLYTKVCKTYGILPKHKISHNARNNHRNSNASKRKSFGKQYCSVYEFSSPQPDSAYLPHWMMQNLGIEEGDKIELQSQFDVPKGNFCKLQPFKQEFMDKVSTIGYKSTLEHSLRHYSVLSINQRIVVEFNHFPYECIVKELKPSNVISILGSTDLEIEFEEALEADVNNSYDEKTASNENENVNDIMDVTEERESSSSFGLSDVDCGYQSNQSNKVKKAEIDGALLKKLGVPLDYNEQNNLATMIVENRELHKEDESRFDDKLSAQNDAVEVNEDDNTEQDEKEEKKDTIADGDLSPIGPDDVKCENCSKWVHSMSIQMHEVHCIRQYVRCKICNQCIKRTDEEQHFTDYHKKFTCICSKVFDGKLAFDEHKLNECSLRLIACKYCDRTNVPFLEYAEHESVCKERTVTCEVCGGEYIAKDKHLHDCGIVCVLCGDRVGSKDKLLHLLTDCRERRAVCNYCGIFRSCIDMEEHRKFCGSRSEQCEICNKFVSLANMEAHLSSNCQWYSNKQLSKNKNKKAECVKVEEQLSTLDIKDIENPYIDQELLNNANDDQSLFGLLKTNPMPDMVDTSFAMDAMKSSAMNKQLCPHCSSSNLLMDEEEFQIHIAVKHPYLINDPMTQAVFASFASPDILSSSKVPNKKKKKKRKLSSDLTQSKRQKRPYNAKRMRANSDSKQKSKRTKWNCPQCTFINSASKCVMCQASRPKIN